jgi:hypothetical protein
LDPRRDRTFFHVALIAATVTTAIHAVRLVRGRVVDMSRLFASAIFRGVAMLLVNALSVLRVGGATRRSYAVSSELRQLQELGGLGAVASFCNLLVLLVAVTGFFATADGAPGNRPRLSPRAFAFAAYPLLVIKLVEGCAFVKNGDWDPVSVEAVLQGIARQPPAWIASVVLVLPFAIGASLVQGPALGLLETAHAEERRRAREAIVIAAVASALIFAFSSLLVTRWVLAFPWWPRLYALIPLASAIACGATGAAAWWPAMRRLWRSAEPYAYRRQLLWRSGTLVLLLVMLAIACAWVTLRERQYSLLDYEPMG